MTSTPAQRIWLQAPLGFGAGVPLLLTASTLTAWLDDAGVSLEVIGFFALISLPYNLKFLWAPVLDRFELFGLGRRRGWMLLCQLLLLVSIATMGAVDAAASPMSVALLGLGVAFLSASQDVVVDAYRTDVLGADELGKGTATYVTGYRLALIATGGGALMLADVVSWRTTYWVMAALMVVGIVAAWRAPAPPAIEPPRTLRDAVFEPLFEFFHRRGAYIALAIVLLYKVGDSLAGHMITPFLLGLDFSKTEIGLIQKLLGMATTIVGCGIGGIVVDKIGVIRGLIIFGLLQALANFGYLALALVGKNHELLIAAIGIDNLCNGMGTAALVAYLMSLCHRRFSATQYALLTSASSLLGRLLGAFSGMAIAALGWAAFFAVSIVVAVPALLLLAWYRGVDK